jgi:hypothetical protein
MVDEGPIYIGGPDRCGKTTVAALLGSHPRIAFSAVGSNLWPFFYRRYGSLAEEANLGRCVDAMLHYKHVAYMRPDRDAILSEFRAGASTYARLFSIVHAQYARAHAKARWGDQTGLVERWADEIFSAYPGVRMIHMLRDPRDRYLASLQMWPEGRLRAGGATARWRLSADLALRNARRHGGRYLVLRYEELAENPRAVVLRLCDFIGEEFDPAMLDMGAMPGVRAKLGAADGLAVDALSPSFIGAYRGNLPAGEVRFIERHAGRQMALLGYAPDPDAASGSLRIGEALLSEPVNALRMGAWRVREGLAFRFPGRFGRKLRADMQR